jgi:hypothetical protein
MTLPIISADKMENPILDSDKMENPILDGDKMENPILESVEAPVVGRSALLIGVDPVGVSKARYTATLGRLGKERSMYFMAAFIESCRSELSADELAALSGPARNVGMLYTSDQKGLTYSTLDYAELLDKKNADKPLSASLRAFLLRKHEEGKPKPN